jgi:hypothetical protein
MSDHSQSYLFLLYFTNPQFGFESVIKKIIYLSLYLSLSLHLYTEQEFLPGFIHIFGK